MLASFCSRLVRKRRAVLKLRRRPELADARRPAFIRMRFPIRPTILGYLTEHSVPLLLLHLDHVMRLLFRMSVLPRETQYFVESVWVKNTSEDQDLPDLLRAADALQVPPPPLPFLPPQEGGVTSRRNLCMALPLRLAFPVAG